MLSLLKLSLLTSSLFLLVSQALALPAGPLSRLPPQGLWSSLRGKPTEDELWPREGGKKHYLLFSDYDFGLDRGVCNEVMQQAVNEVTKDISLAPEREKQAVTKPRFWKYRDVRLDVEPTKDGFNLGDLGQYLLLMESFQKHYAEYWEWKAQMLGPGLFGSLDQVGLAKFGIDRGSKQQDLDSGIQTNGEWRPE